MGVALTNLTSPPLSYNFDDSHPGITPQMYLNDRLNDCVIAARAHHTVRLAYIYGFPILNISADEISTEYDLEAGPFDLGIVLRDSLARWRDDGWKAGSVLRKIKDFIGPLSIDGSGMRAGDATTDLDLSQLKNCIIDNTGVQADLLLPNGISCTDRTTYGLNTVWKDVTLPQSSNNRHVMVLTGYDGDGPIGITWGTQQHMTWQFLQKYCTGIYWVQKGDST